MCSVKKLTFLFCTFSVSFVFEVLFFMVTLFSLFIISAVGVTETAAGSSEAVFNCRISSRLVIDAKKTRLGLKFSL